VAESQGGFVHLEDEAAHPELAHWHGNIGDPVELDLAPPLTREPEVIDVISWNVAIGHGRVVDVVNQLRAGAFDGETRADDRPLVLLLQEAYRADATVPAAPASRHHGGKQPRNQRHDVVDVANALRFSLRYAPSMRNGRHRSDRGNAILSGAGIAQAHFFTLPHVRQRRAAVTAELHGLPWLTFATAHLDTRGGWPAAVVRRYGLGRSVQARMLATRLARHWPATQSVLLGADLNTYFGTREPLLLSLEAAGFQRMPHQPARSHTMHSRPFGMLLDHILLRTPGHRIASVHVQRLDEQPGDRGMRVFGSDHHPLLARIALVPQNRGTTPTEEG
jgi:endonuclease/exonuclease/phosphatase family metal-dependent hydrolase